MFRRGFSLIFLIWILIGIFVAVQYDYINERNLNIFLNAVLAILLWPLVLLGVNIRV